MASLSSCQRTVLSSEVALGLEMAPCTACRNTVTKAGSSTPKCIVGGRSKRCSECVRKGYAKCDVTLTAPQWVKFREAREKLRREVERIEEEEVSLLHKLADRRQKKIRLRKQLRLAERRTEDAVGVALDALEETDIVAESLLPSLDEGVEAIAPVPSFHDILELSPTDWLQMSGLPPDWPPGPWTSFLEGPSTEFVSSTETNEIA